MGLRCKERKISTGLETPVKANLFLIVFFLNSHKYSGMDNVQKR